jgi:hypothetical protein
VVYYCSAVYKTGRQRQDRPALPPRAPDRRHLAAVRPRGRRHHPVREVSGAELRKVVPPQRRPQRPPVLLTDVPHARLAAALTPTAGTGGSPSSQTWRAAGAPRTRYPRISAAPASRYQDSVCPPAWLTTPYSTKIYFGQKPRMSTVPTRFFAPTEISAENALTGSRSFPTTTI